MNFTRVFNLPSYSRLTVSHLVAMLCVMFSVACGAESATADKKPAKLASPIEACWQQVSNRIELSACLQAMLAQQQVAYEAAKAQAMAQMVELEAVSEAQGLQEQLQHTVDAGEGYAKQLCQWQAATMRGASGEGDQILSCKIIQLSQQTQQLLTMF